MIKNGESVSNGESAVKQKTSFFLFRGNLLGIFSWFFVLLFYVICVRYTKLGNPNPLDVPILFRSPPMGEYPLQTTSRNPFSKGPTINEGVGKVFSKGPDKIVRW